MQIPLDAEPNVPFTVQIPADAEPNVPFTVQIPADAAAPAEPPKPGKKNAVPFHTASLPRMAEPEEEPEDDDTEFFPKRKKKAKKPPVEAEPVGTARDACVQYGKQLKANKLRLRLGLELRQRVLLCCRGLYDRRLHSHFGDVLIDWENPMEPRILRGSRFSFPVHSLA